MAVIRKNTPPITSTKHVVKIAYCNALKSIKLLLFDGMSCKAATIVPFVMVGTDDDDCNFEVRITRNASEIIPMKYGLPASPKACETSSWKPSADDLRVGTTTYSRMSPTIAQFKFNATCPKNSRTKQACEFLGAVIAQPTRKGAEHNKPAPHIIGSTLG
uniref:Uncharacterized protein n=1 Tax=Photinus pyralis TaxID=7054 RepID=A0A1Y1LGK0_PHOPY